MTPHGIMDLLCVGAINKTNMQKVNISQHSLELILTKKLGNLFICVQYYYNLLLITRTVPSPEVVF
jgi:selenophosphate synthase